MRKLTCGMNLSLDGYIAAPGDDLGWGVQSDELFQWWSDRLGATGLALYGRKLREELTSSHWPTADQQPGATPAQIEFAGRWRDMPKVVFSSTTSAVDWNARLVTGDAVTEITRLKTEDGDFMDVGGATLAAAAMRAGLIDEYAIVTHPVLVGGGHAVLHRPRQLGEPEPGGDPDVSRRRAPDQVRDQALNPGRAPGDRDGDGPGALDRRARRASRDPHGVRAARRRAARLHAQGGERVAAAARVERAWAHGAHRGRRAAAERERDGARHRPVGSMRSEPVPVPPRATPIRAAVASVHVESVNRCTRLLNGSATSASPPATVTWAGWIS